MHTASSKSEWVDIPIFTTSTTFLVLLHPCFGVPSTRYPFSQYGENLQGLGKRPSTARHLGQEHSSIQHRHIRLLATCGARCAHPDDLKPTGNGWKRDMRHTSKWRFSWEE